MNKKNVNGHSKDICILVPNRHASSYYFQLKSLHFSLFVTFSLWWPRYDLLSIYIQWHTQSRVLNLSCVSSCSSSFFLFFHPQNFSLSLSSPFQFKASDHNRSTIHHFLFTRYAENEIPTLTMSTLYYFISLNQTKQNRFIFYEYVFFFFKLSKFDPFLTVCWNCFLLIVVLCFLFIWVAQVTDRQI